MIDTTNFFLYFCAHRDFLNPKMPMCSLNSKSWLRHCLEITKLLNTLGPKSWRGSLTALSYAEYLLNRLGFSRHRCMDELLGYEHCANQYIFSGTLTKHGEKSPNSNYYPIVSEEAGHPRDFLFLRDRLCGLRVGTCRRSGRHTQFSSSTFFQYQQALASLLRLIARIISIAQTVACNK